MGLLTRDAKPADAPAVSRLLDALGYPATEEEARAHIERFTAGPATRLQVVTEDGSGPIGLVATHLVPRLDRDLHTCRITELVTDPERRRGGVGAALLAAAAAEAEARERGAVRLDLTSGEWRDASHSFYGAMGYERVAIGYLRRLD